MTIPLLDAIDVEILMHRDIHFGGSFEIMVHYYEKEGVGVMPDFSLKRIKQLKKLEEELQENLSAKCLPLPTLELIERAKAIYRQLREVYEKKENPLGILISDLILTEEDLPKKEIEALVAQGEEGMQALIKLIDSSDFYDPLYPGYGRAPMHAATALGKIGNPKAIPHLFMALGQQNFFVDEAIIQALNKMGKPAKEFLLKRLVHKPITQDNEHAAIVLTSFPLDEEIALIALSLLQEEEVLKHEGFCSYLICAVEGLQKKEERERFLALAKSGKFSKLLKNEAAMVVKAWL